MRKRVAIAAFSASLTLSAPAVPVEPYRGMLLYENYCHYCHYRNIHFRPHSKVRSLDDLREQIDIWQAELGLGWNRRDIVDVQAFLNWLYYGYPYSMMIPIPNP